MDADLDDRRMRALTLVEALSGDLHHLLASCVGRCAGRLLPDRPAIDLADLVGAGATARNGAQEEPDDNAEPQESRCVRHLYDLTSAWGGRHPLDVPTVVLTHNPPDDRPREDENFVFVTEGIEAPIAKAQEIAGDITVAVNSGQMARQALEAGLLDEVGFDLVPVILGAGTRFFAGLEHMPMELDGPILHVEGIGVTHLRYRGRNRTSETT